MPLFWHVFVCGTVLVPCLFVLKSTHLTLFQTLWCTKIASFCQHLYGIPLNFVMFLFVISQLLLKAYSVSSLLPHYSLTVKWAHGSSITLFYQACERNTTACEISGMLHCMLLAGLHQHSLFQSKKTACECFEC